MDDRYVTAGQISRCELCSVRNRAVCGALNQDELEHLNRIARRKLVHAGETILSDQEPAAFFGNIVSGVVKLTKTLSDGRQQIVGLQFAPDFLGRAFSAKNPYFAEAATDVDLCLFHRADFEKLMGTYPDLEHRLFERTLHELDAAREWMVLLGRKTAEEKVASFLLMLANRSAMIGCADDATPNEARFVLPLTRSDIADYLGLTIETVSRQITRLRVRNFIRPLDSRTFLVPNLELLTKAAGHDPEF
jgi:CRP/FNR family transcriptional regulator, anaerobic regulatory protein